MRAIQSATACSLACPSLSYIDSGRYSEGRKRAPVTSLLLHQSYQTKPWDRLAITKWMQAKGCDIHAHGADGQTLLHVAAEAGDIQMVRNLLDQGMSASTPGAFSLPALGSAHDEDVALMLLEAVTDASKMDDGGNRFRRFAVYNYWGRVVGWLDAHESVKPSPTDQK